jgi:hypothetical protein
MDDDKPTLRNIFRSIQEHVKNGGLIVLDDLSELLVHGFSAHEITRFVRAVISLARKVRIPPYHLTTANTSAIAQVDHRLPPTRGFPGIEQRTSLFQPNSYKQTVPDLDLLLRLLRLGGGVWWRIEGLRTGRSGVVTGEVRRLFRMSLRKLLTMPRSLPIRSYRCPWTSR